jgi:hypothetical protein
MLPQVFTAYPQPQTQQCSYRIPRSYKFNHEKENTGNVKQQTNFKTAPPSELRTKKEF